MTTAHVAGALWRRWFLVLLGLVLTFGAAGYVHLQKGLYWSQTDVVFLAPSSRVTNSLQQSPKGVTMIAGLVGAELNKGKQQPATASAGATLAGMGVRDGYLIRLPNSGGQWAQNFDRPVLDVQVIGSDRDKVAAQMAALRHQIDVELAQLQSADGTDPADFVTASPVPATPQVFYLNGNPGRALLVTLALGLLGTVVLTLAADTLLTRRARRRATRAVRAVRQTRLTDWDVEPTHDPTDDPTGMPVDELGSDEPRPRTTRAVREPVGR